MNERFFANSANINEKRGFLPDADPQTQLSESSVFANHINELVKNAPQLLQERKLRAEIDALDAAFPDALLIATKKGCKEERNTTLLFLKTLVQAYIWEDPEHPANTVPSILTRNLYPLCKSRQCYPIITYADYVLNNWRRIDTNKPISLDNIEPIVTFTGTADEAWFIKIHVVIEAVCASALHAACMACHQVNEGKEEDIIQSFKKIQQSLTIAINILHRMIEGCRPDIFSDKLRPYLNGWEKVKSADNDEVGVRLLGLTTRDKLPAKYTGPSGAQSGIMPALDSAFGIKHEIDGMLVKLRDFKEYMPLSHQAFILGLQNSKLRKFSKKTHSEELIAAYDEAVKTIGQFRGAHLSLIHQYIYRPAQERGMDHSKITGTGGAPIDDYLAGRYANTMNGRI
jgi:indoleamine 2,3-dioxygenase